MITSGKTLTTELHGNALRKGVMVLYCNQNA